MKAILRDPHGFVRGVQERDQGALEILYRAVIGTSVWLYLVQRLGPEAEDAAHEVYLAAVEKIGEGQVRDPETVGGYIWGIARFTVQRKWEKRFRGHYVSGQEYPEELFVWRNWLIREREWRRVEARRERFRKVSAGLRPKVRELIQRYLDGQEEEEIRAAMGIEGHAWQVLKNQAKKTVKERLNGDQ